MSQNIKQFYNNLIINFEYFLNNKENQNIIIGTPDYSELNLSFDK